jgi:hypothetical protein
MNSRDIYFLNVPERAGRRWEEFRSGGYLSTVGCARALDALSELAAGDVLAAYVRRCGYVGVGIVTASVQATPASQSEYVLPVMWLRAVDREHACWLPRRGLFSSPQIKASLAAQPATLRYLQNAFAVSLDEGSNCKPSPAVRRYTPRHAAASIVGSTKELLIPY